jgi:4-hydroxy-tetrahydrodipicolinate reductase
MKTVIYIHGSQGKMGRTVAALAEADGLSLSPDLPAAAVAIDFSAPPALTELLENCSSLKKPLVVGTTGHSPENEALLKAAAEHIPILFSPNFSLGLAVCLEAAQLMASRLKEKAHIEIIEAHHSSKKDQPSGSALALGRATDAKKIHAIRAGDIVGDHTVLFVMKGERIELKHQVQSREAFAKGALVAAEFLKNQQPGLYTIKDLLCI